MIIADLLLGFRWRLHLLTILVNISINLYFIGLLFLFILSIFGCLVLLSICCSLWNHTFLCFFLLFINAIFSFTSIRVCSLEVQALVRSMLSQTAWTPAPSTTHNQHTLSPSTAPSSTTCSQYCASHIFQQKQPFLFET